MICNNKMKVKVLFFNYILVPSMRIYLYFPVIVFGKLFKKSSLLHNFKFLCYYVQQIELIHILNILLYKYIKFVSNSVYLSFIYQNTAIGCQPFE